MATRELLTRLLFPAPTGPPQAVQPGLYHYMRSAGQDSYAPGAYTRFHLRVDPDGRGLLLANASAALHLSPSGVVIAKGLLDDESEDEIIARLRNSFRGTDRQTMVNDLERVAGRIASLVAPGDNYPVMNLEDAAVSPYDARLMAPFQADVLLAPSSETAPILDSLWRANIPHVTLMVSPDVDRTQLVQAIERAEDLGMIAGVRARATDLSAPSLLVDMAMAGLDHCNVLFVDSDAARHDDICGPGDHARAITLLQAIRANEIAAVAEVPLLDSSTDSLLTTLDLLLQHDVNNVNFLSLVSANDLPDMERAGSLPASALPQMADMVEELAAELDVRFIWQPPVQRDPALTLAEQIRLGPRCTADVSIRVLPNGDVISPRGPAIVAGNLLSDEWTAIWGNASFVSYRERVERPTRCEECPGLMICAADCPREPAGWSQGVGGAAR